MSFRWESNPQCSPHRVRDFKSLVSQPFAPLKDLWDWSESNRHGPFGPRDFKSRMCYQFHHSPICRDGRICTLTVIPNPKALGPVCLLISPHLNNFANIQQVFHFHLVLLLYFQVRYSLTW